VQTLKQAIAVLQGKTDPAPTRTSSPSARPDPAHPHDRRHPPAAARGRGLRRQGRQVRGAEDHAEIDETAIFDSRGGNNLLLDDEKLTAWSPT
jgi:hypothetical protein